MEHSTYTVWPNKPVFHTARVFSGTPGLTLAKPLSPDAVKNVLQETGRELLPPAIDIDELAKQLGNCGFWLRYFSRSSERDRVSARREFLRKLKTQAELLSELMAASPNGPWLKADRNLADRIALLLNDVDHQLKALQNSGLPTSPFAWLVGAHLPQIFENFLKRPAGISRHRKKHNPRGPYLRFVKSVLGALSETNNYRGTHSDETIVRAFTTNKSLSTAAKAAAAASAQRELDRFYSRKSDLYANCC